MFTAAPALPDQLADDVAQALESAEARAEADPADLAPPYVDRTTGRIVAGVRTGADSTKTAYAAGSIGVDPSTVDNGNDDANQEGLETGKTEEPASETAAAEPEAAQAVVIPKIFYPSTPKAKYSLADLDAVKDAVLEKIANVGRHMQPGDPLDPATRLGAIVDETQMKRVLSYIDSGRTDGARVALGPRHPPDHRAVGHVVAHAQVRKERVVLEDRVHAPPVRRHVLRRLAEQPHVAGGRGLEARDQPQAGGLARARGPEHGEERALAYLEVHRVDGAHVAEVTRHALEGDRRDHQRPPITPM